MKGWEKMDPECIFVLDHYNDYISGELHPDKIERVEKHLKLCPNCENFLSKAFQIHGRTIDLLKRVPAPKTLKKSISDLFDSA